MESVYGILPAHKVTRLRIIQIKLWFCLTLSAARDPIYNMRGLEEIQIHMFVTHLYYLNNMDSY